MSEASTSVMAMAVCESCFLSDHTRWEPESMDQTGSIIMKLIGVDVPIKVNNGSVEVCCTCGGLTVSGIYELKSKDEVDFTDDGNNHYELELHEFDPNEDPE